MSRRLILFHFGFAKILQFVSRFLLPHSFLNLNLNRKYIFFLLKILFALESEVSAPEKKRERNQAARRPSLTCLSPPPRPSPGERRQHRALDDSILHALAGCGPHPLLGMDLLGASGGESLLERLDRMVRRGAATSTEENDDNEDTAVLSVIDKNHRWALRLLSAGAVWAVANLVKLKMEEEATDSKILIDAWECLKTGLLDDRDLAERILIEDKTIFLQEAKEFLLDRLGTGELASGPFLREVSRSSILSSRLRGTFAAAVVESGGDPFLVDAARDVLRAAEAESPPELKSLSGVCVRRGALPTDETLEKFEEALAKAGESSEKRAALLLALPPGALARLALESARRRRSSHVHLFPCAASNLHRWSVGDLEGM